MEYLDLRLPLATSEEARTTNDVRDEEPPKGVQEWIITEQRQNTGERFTVKTKLRAFFRLQK